VNIKGADKIKASQGYRITRISDPSQFALIESKWGQMLFSSKSEDKIYQTQQFFNFVSETAENSRDWAELLVIERCTDGEIVGIVPVRPRIVPIEFRLSRRIALSIKIPTIMLMGSAPMLANEPGAMDYLLAALVERYPRCRVASMPACPVEYFDDMNLGADRRNGLTSYVLNGWQDCHTIPLPGSFDAYAGKLSAKKRYNLTRQIRQWAQQAGPLEVHRVDRPDQVQALRQALRGLMPPKEYDALLSEAKWRALAERGLLLCYTVTGGDEVVAAVVGTRACGVWHVHNILSDRKYQHLSPGTSVVHLALQDVIDNLSMVRADFGYGRPKQEFRSTHVLRSRGHVLFCSRRSPVRMLFALHRAHTGIAAHLLRAAASLKQWSGAAGAAIRGLAKPRQGEGEAG
jgi:hypothetical protein